MPNVLPIIGYCLGGDWKEGAWELEEEEDEVEVEYEEEDAEEEEEEEDEEEEEEEEEDEDEEVGEAEEDEEEGNWGEERMLVVEVVVVTLVSPLRFSDNSPPSISSSLTATWSSTSFADSSTLLFSTVTPSLEPSVTSGEWIIDKMAAMRGLNSTSPWVGGGSDGLIEVSSAASSHHDMLSGALLFCFTLYKTLSISSGRSIRRSSQNKFIAGKGTVSQVWADLLIEEIPLFTYIIYTIVRIVLFNVFSFFRVRFNSVPAPLLAGSYYILLDDSFSFSTFLHIFPWSFWFLLGRPQ